MKKMRPIFQTGVVAASELCALAPRCPGFQRESVDEHVDAMTLCAMCNTSMGTRDLAEYRATLHPH